VGRAIAALGLTLAVSLGLATGCGDGESEQESATPASGHPPPARHAESPRGDRVAPVRCPPGGGNCESASGEIIYVERVDPDGDGDAHFVLLSDEGVTAPGISVIDVERSLRPHPLPGPGDLVSAAGPVYRGSHGQLQIQATEMHVSGAG
jgi:hypothetical protein